MYVDVTNLVHLPVKRMAAAALLFGEDERLLIVKPWYRPHWLLPGGMVERDESPRQACAREAREELGLDIAPQRLLCVDYTTATDEASESLQFVFWAGRLDASQCETIQLQADELTEWRLVTPTEGHALLAPRLTKRLPACLHALTTGVTLYLEDGVPVDVSL
ncbi:MAG TPA: NUDIX hydrolase [Ktedonobacterales bacterium]|nr:NUDIX hydrolase [Ktedonobacterales bacterium]